MFPPPCQGARHGRRRVPGEEKPDGVWRFGLAGSSDDLPIDQWMDDRNGEVGLRDAFDAIGRQRWDASTRTGDYLDASRPGDVVAIGSIPTGFTGSDIARPSSTGSGMSANGNPSAPAVRYVRARAGDKISSLVGSSNSNAIGAFARINGMDGRNSTIYAGRVYAIPAADGDASADDTALGQHLLGQEDAEAEDASPRVPQLTAYANPAVGGTILARGTSKKDECIRQCTPLLERYQPPGSDRNRWDFHKCVNQCMEGDGKASPAPLPSTPSPAPHGPGRVPWWLMIPRLVPELPLVPV
jgi:hypothetical protein